MNKELIIETTHDSNKKMNISAVIVCYNEGHLLKTCLDNISFCNELILVDMDSSDDSIEIAKLYGAKIVVYPRVYHPNLPRQYGIEQAKSQWVLTLDPDEIFPENEKYMIERLISIHYNSAAIRLPIQYYFKNKKLKCTFVGRENNTRWALINKKKIISTPYVHNEFSLNQDIVYCSRKEIDPIKHYWRNSYSELFRKMWLPLRTEGQAQYEQGLRFSAHKLFMDIAISLKSNLIVYNGITSVTGLTLSLYWALYVFLRGLCLRQYEKKVKSKKEQRNKNSIFSHNTCI